MFCRKPVEYDKTVCESCGEEAPVIESDNCLICSHTPCVCEGMEISQLISPFYYEMGVDIAIQDLKFNNNQLNARKLAIYMAEAARKNNIAIQVDGMVPIPLYKKDLHKRGYNQAKLLAKHISAQLEIPVYSDVLLKVKPTGKQHKLSFEERRTNLMGAFQIKNTSVIQDKTLLLIDDVYTTGRTMNICGELLKQSGAKCIIGLTAAKTRYRKNEPMMAIN